MVVCKITEPEIGKTTKRPVQQYSHRRTVPHMSYGQHYWLTKRTWILNKDVSRGLYMIPISNPMSILNMALLSIVLTVAQTRINMVSMTKAQVILNCHGPRPVLRRPRGPGREEIRLQELQVYAEFLLRGLVKRTYFGLFRGPGMRFWD